MSGWQSWLVSTVLGLAGAVVGSLLVTALQTIVSRNADPRQAAVLSVTKIQAGNAYNVIPAEAILEGETRSFVEGEVDRLLERFEQ